MRSQEDLAGYITLLADKLTVEEQILLPEGIKYRTFPAIKIGLLATEQRCKGVGSILVQWAIQYVVYTLVPLVGVRFITVDALYDPETGYDSSGFYQRCGFLYVNSAEILPPSSGYRTMYFDLKPLLDTLGALG